MPTTPILLYHRITEVDTSTDPYGIAVSPAVFERQIAYLKDQRFTPLSLDAYLNLIQHQEPIPARSVVITFDDGYLDNYTTAAPILQKYGFIATIFLVSGQLGSNTNWKNQRNPIPLMSWEQARELQEMGFEMGSHTVNHVNLRESDETVARRELVDSRKMIEDRLGHPVTTLSFPYEDLQLRDISLVEEAGYKGACGSPLFPESRFNLWRNEIYGHTTFSQFQGRIKESFHTYLWLRHQSPLGHFAKWVKHQLKERRG